MTEELIKIIAIFSKWVEKVGSNFSKKNELILFYNTLNGEKPLIKMDFNEDSIYYFGFGNILYDKNIDERNKNINNRNISVAFYNLFLILNTYGENFFEKKNKSIINSFFNFYKEYYILFDWITSSNYLNVDKIKIYEFDEPDFIIETEDEIIPVEVSIAEDLIVNFIWKIRMLLVDYLVYHPNLLIMNQYQKKI